MSWAPSEMRWLFKRARPFLHWHLATCLCLGTSSALALVTPLTLKWLIDQVLPQSRVELLAAAVGLIFLGYQGRMTMASVGNYLMLSAAQKMALALRMDLLRHLDTLSADYHESTSVGTMMYRFREPTEEIAYFGSDLIPAVLRLVLTACFTLATMCLLSPALTFAILPLAPIFLLTRRYFRTRLSTDSDAAQYAQQQWSAFLQEHLSSVTAIQLLGQQRCQEANALPVLVSAVSSQRRVFRTGMWFTACTSLAIVLVLCATVGYGGWSVLAGTMTLGALVAFYSLVAQLFEPLSGAAELYAKAQRTFASVRQVQGVLAMSPTVADSPDALAAPTGPWGQIELVAVEFGYVRPLLRIGWLHISQGEQIAVAGENGAGKSTLAKLISRLYDVDSGSVRIGCHDVRTIRLDDLRRHVCYLPRDPVMFNGTLASNLRLAKATATDFELHEAIRCAGLSEWIATLPEGLQQRVGPGGCQLSGGQRQRLAIARSLLRRPQILIFDEATCCLDAASELSIFGNVRRYLNDVTLIVVTHRLSTMSFFNRILILSGGRVIADGTLSSLMSHESACRKLFVTVPSAGTDPLL